jgi:hypothetical protein
VNQQQNSGLSALGWTLAVVAGLAVALPVLFCILSAVVGAFIQ